MIFLLEYNFFSFFKGIKQGLVDGKEGDKKPPTS